MAKQVAKKEDNNLPGMPTGIVQNADYSGYQGPTGKDDIANEDVNIPRIKLGQALTPEVKDRDNPAQTGDFLHNITGEVLSAFEEPLLFIPVAHTVEYIIWADRKGGKKGILNRAVRTIDDKGNIRYKWQTPNVTIEDKIGGNVPVSYECKEYVDEDGLAEWGTQIPGNEDSGPAATKHLNYLVVLPAHEMTMMALSLSRTQIKPGKDLGAILKSSSAPTFARVISMTSFTDSRDEDEFANVKFRPAGLVAPDSDLFEQLRSFYVEMKDRGINVDYSDDTAGDETSGDADGKF